MCGAYPDLKKCTCSTHDIHRYMGKISKPLLDRIDICMNVKRLPYKELSCSTQNESSSQIRERILCARDIQAKRYQGTEFRFNADLGAKELRTYCPLGQDEEQLLECIYEKMDLSVRTLHRIIKVSRTIADLEGRAKITERHISEAVFYKCMDLE